VHELPDRSRNGDELISRSFLQTNPWPSYTSTWAPQWHWCGVQISRPSRSPIATLTASSSIRMPQDAMGKVCSQSPLCCDDAARKAARWKVNSGYVSPGSDQLEYQGGPRTAVQLVRYLECHQKYWTKTSVIIIVTSSSRARRQKEPQPTPTSTSSTTLPICSRSATWGMSLKLSTYSVYPAKSVFFASPLSLPFCLNSMDWVAVVSVLVLCAWLQVTMQISYVYKKWTRRCLNETSIQRYNNLVSVVCWDSSPGKFTKGPQSFIAIIVLSKQWLDFFYLCLCLQSVHWQLSSCVPW